MINFKSITVKNFMSVGNKPLGYDFQNGKVYLVTGANGSGKSAILLDGLLFALYGYPFRKVNKPLMINSINNSNCEARIVFESDGVEYVIERGMKPNFLRLFIDGVQKKNDAANLDMQKFIEKNVLKINHQTFRQIVILGSKEFVPFMTLPGDRRRVVIEDILNLSIFQMMANVTKQKIQEVVSKAKSLDSEISSVSAVISETTNIITTIQNSGGSFVKEKQERIQSLSSENDLYMEKIEQNLNAINTILGDNDPKKEITEIKKKLSELNDMEIKVNSSLKSIKKDVEFLKSNSICPTCHQEISDHYKDEFHTRTDSKIKELVFCSDVAKTYRQRLESDKKTTSELIDEILKLEMDNAELQNKIARNIDIIKTTNLDIEDYARRSNSDYSQFELKLVEFNKKMSELKDSQLKIIKSGRQLSVIFELVKDGGIRNKIIQQYLPSINLLIKQYLDLMGANMDFVFDEHFNETIKSRHRDNFPYASFSEGQKLRIDLCLLFTWREISRIRNSAATNLIVFDEIGDSSLDVEGFDCLMKVIESEKQRQCVIIISHSPDKISSKCDRIYEYELQRGFTSLKSVVENLPEESLT